MSSGALRQADGRGRYRHPGDRRFLSLFHQGRRRPLCRLGGVSRLAGGGGGEQCRLGPARPSDSYCPARADSRVEHVLSDVVRVLGEKIFLKNWKRVVWGKSGSVRVYFGGRPVI